MRAFWNGLAVIVVAAALVYAGIVALLYFKQRDLIYFPQATRVPAADTDFELTNDGVTLRGWVVNPGSERAILYFGGNAESLQFFRDEAAQAFPGHTVYLVAYRGYGASEGVPSESALFGDAIALYDHVAALHPGARISVIGRSLGSGVASYLASQRPVSELVLVTPFDSLARTARAHYSWLPMQWLLKDHFDSTRYLADYHGPILILRAGRDQVVPPANTDRLVAALPETPTVVALAQADHNDISEDPRYLQSLRDFIR